MTSEFERGVRAAAEIVKAEGLAHLVGRIKRTLLPPVAPAGDREAVEERHGWKCNCCQTVFTSTQAERAEDPSGVDHNRGAKCPCCKAEGQYTYPYRLHEGDPCKHCGTPHDAIAPGACSGAMPAQPAEERAVTLRGAEIDYGGPDHRSGKYWISLNFGEWKDWHEAKAALSRARTGSEGVS